MRFSRSLVHCRFCIESWGPRSRGMRATQERAQLIQTIRLRPINALSKRLPSTRVLCAAALLVGLAGAMALASVGQAAMIDQTPKAIAWDQVGAKAAADYQGEALTVRPNAAGARLHCAFQRLDGEGTREGLWLTSTVTNQAHARFRVR